MSIPSDQALEKALRDATRALLDNGVEITVNKVRTRVEENLDLPERFFNDTPEWKGRSKEVIHSAIAGDESDHEPKSKETKPVKKTAVKRQSSEEPEHKPKRVKKEPTPKKVVKKAAPKRAAAKKKTKKPASSESELSDLDQSEEEEKPKKSAGRTKKKVESESELSDLGSEEEEDVKPSKAAEKRRSKTKTALSEDEDKIKNDPDSSTERKRKRPTKRTKIESESENEVAEQEESIIEQPKADKLKSEAKTEDQQEDKKPQVVTKGVDRNAAAEDDSSELSSVIDDAPPKRKKVKKESKPAADDDSSDLSSVIDDGPPKKRKPKGANGSSKQKTSKAAPKEATGDEAEIKKLQGHLLKCGIRKIWGIELKEYGNDSRAKIRHLKKLLADAGISGRFSEAKAKEIKERRELLADLGAVQEMNELWGSDPRGGRASRSKAKASLKEESEQESEAEEKKPRVTKRMADLAFLGSESESE